MWLLNTATSARVNFDPKTPTHMLPWPKLSSAKSIVQLPTSSRRATPPSRWSSQLSHTAPWCFWASWYAACYSPCPRLVVSPKKVGAWATATAARARPGVQHDPEVPISTFITHWRTDDSLTPYPGQGVSQASLQVHERMGQTLLAELLLSEGDLETHVRAVMGIWKEESKYFPLLLMQRR